MKVFVLIIMLSGANGSPAIHSQEFTSKDTCQEAASRLKAPSFFNQLSAVCTEK